MLIGRGKGVRVATPFSRAFVRHGVLLPKARQPGVATRFIDPCGKAGRRGPLAPPNTYKRLCGAFSPQNRPDAGRFFQRFSRKCFQQFR